MQYIFINNHNYVCFNELMPDDEFDEIIHGNVHEYICINSAIPEAEYKELIDSGKSIVFNAKIKNVYDFITAINIKKFEWNYGKLQVSAELQDTIRYTFSGCYYWIKKIELICTSITIKQCLAYMRGGIIRLYFEEESYNRRSNDSSSSDDENKPIHYDNDIVYYIPRTSYFVSRSIFIYALRKLVACITNHRITKKILNQLSSWGFTDINELIRGDYCLYFTKNNWINILKQIQNKHLRHMAYNIFYGRKLKYNYRP